MNPFDIYKIILTVVSVGYTIIFGMVARRIWDIPNLIDQKLGIYHKQIAHQLNENEKRIDVHDRISSRIHGKEIDSKAIATSGIYPEFKLRKIEH